MHTGYHHVARVILFFALALLIQMGLGCGIDKTFPPELNEQPKVVSIGSLVRQIGTNAYEIRQRVGTALGDQAFLTITDPNSSDSFTVTTSAPAGNILGITVGGTPTPITRSNSSDPVKMSITGTFNTTGTETLTVTISDGINPALVLTLTLISIRTDIVAQSVTGPVAFPAVNAASEVEIRQQSVATAFTVVFQITGIDTNGPLTATFALNTARTAASYPNATVLTDVGVGFSANPASVAHQGTVTLSANPPAVDANNAALSRPGKIYIDVTIQEAAPSAVTVNATLVIVVADNTNALQLNFNQASALPQPVTQVTSPGAVVFETSIDDFDAGIDDLELPFFGTGDPSNLSLVVSLDSSFTAQTYGTNPAVTLGDFPLTLDLQAIPITGNSNSSNPITLGTNFSFVIRQSGRMPQPSSLDGTPPGKFKLDITVSDPTGSETISILVTVAAPPRVNDVELIASETWDQVGGIFDSTFQGWRNPTFVSFTTVFNTPLPSTLSFIVPRTTTGGLPEFSKLQLRLVLDTTRSSPGFNNLQNSGLEFRGAEVNSTELSATGSGEENTIEIGIDGTPAFSGDLYFELEAWGEDASGQRIGSQRRATVYFRIFDTPPAFVFEERLYDGLNAVHALDDSAGGEAQAWIGGGTGGAARIDHLIDSFLRDPIRVQQTFDASVTGGPTPPTDVLKLVGGMRPSLTGRWTAVAGTGPTTLSNAAANWPIDYWKDVVIQPDQSDPRKLKVLRNTATSIILAEDVSGFVAGDVNNTGDTYVSLGRVADEGQWAAEPTYPNTVGNTENLTEFILDGDLAAAPADSLVGYTIIPIVDATNNANVSNAEREEYQVIRSVNNRVYVNGDLTGVLTGLTGQNYMLIGRRPVTMAALVDTGTDGQGDGVLICDDADRNDPTTWTPMAFSPALSTLSSPVIADIFIDDTADRTSPAFVMIALVRETAGAKRVKTYRFRSVDSAIGDATISNASTTVTMTSGTVANLAANDYVRINNEVFRVVSVNAGAGTFVVDSTPAASGTNVGVYFYRFVGDSNFDQNLLIYEGQWSAVNPSGSPTTLSDASQQWTADELNGFTLIPDISQPTQFDTIDDTLPSDGVDPSRVTVSAPPALANVTAGENGSAQDYYRVLGIPTPFQANGVLAVSPMVFRPATDANGPQFGWMLVTFQQPGAPNTLRHQLYRTSIDRDTNNLLSTWNVFWVPVEGAFFLSRESVTDFAFIGRGGARSKDEWYIGVGEGVPVIYEFEPSDDDVNKGALNKLKDFPAKTSNAGTGRILSFAPVPGNSEMVWVGADNANLYLATLDVLAQRRDEIPVDTINSALGTGFRDLSFPSASFGVVISGDRYVRFGGRDNQINPDTYVRDVRSPNPGTPVDVTLSGFGHPPIHFAIGGSITENSHASRGGAWTLTADAKDVSVVDVNGGKLRWNADYDPFIFDNNPYDPQNENTGFRYNLYASGVSIGNFDGVANNDTITENGGSVATVNVGDYVEFNNVTLRVIAKGANSLQFSQPFPYTINGREAFRVPPFAIVGATLTMTAGNSTITSSADISASIRPGDTVQIGTEGFGVVSVAGNGLSFVVDGTPDSSVTTTATNPGYKHPPFRLPGTVEVQTGNLTQIFGTANFATLITVNDYVRVGDETRKVTAVLGTQLTVDPAFDDPKPAGTWAFNMLKPPTLELQISTLTHGSGPNPQSNPPRSISAGGNDNVNENGIYILNARTVQRAGFGGPWGIPRGWAVASAGTGLYPNGQRAGWVHSSQAPTPITNVDTVYLVPFAKAIQAFTVGAGAQITLASAADTAAFAVGDILTFSDIQPTAFATALAAVTTVRVTNVAGAVITTDLDSTGFGAFTSGNLSLDRVADRLNRRLVRRFSNTHTNPLTASFNGATPDDGYLIVDSDAHFIGATGDVGDIDTSLFSPVIDASVGEDSRATIAFRFRRYNLGGSAVVQARKFEVAFSENSPNEANADSASWGDWETVAILNNRNNPDDGWEYYSVTVDFDSLPFKHQGDGDEVWQIFDQPGGPGGANVNAAYNSKYVQFRLRFSEATWAGWWLVDEIVITP